MIAEKYKKVAMELLADYLESAQSLICEYSGDFKKSALSLKKHVMEYLERKDLTKARTHLTNLSRICGFLITTEKKVRNEQ